mgnify:CR=1 FL=1
MAKRNSCEWFCVDDINDYIYFYISGSNSGIYRSDFNGGQTLSTFATNIILLNPAQGVTMLLPPYESDPLTKPPDEIVKVQVRADGKVLFNGEKIRISQIEQKARNELTEFQMIKGAEKQPIFKLVTAAKAEFQLYLQVVDQLKAAKCTKVSVVWE